MEQIIAGGRVTRPLLGIAFAPDASAEQLGVRGVLVLSAREGGPAYKAGLRGTTRDSYGCAPRPAGAVGRGGGFVGVCVWGVPAGNGARARLPNTLPPHPPHPPPRRLVLGDIITGINGKPVRTSSDLFKILDKLKVGDSLAVDLLRGNSEERVAVVLEETPPAGQQP